MPDGSKSPITQGHVIMPLWLFSNQCCTPQGHLPSSGSGSIKLSLSVLVSDSIDIVLEYSEVLSEAIEITSASLHLLLGSGESDSDGPKSRSVSVSVLK